ncbi:hypothetical protein [Peribacillus frigoritolerans]|uniref:hypothetical protein n=1 Tax=Peribacillus frigoritolerans TaxID=450367 RepID=UPI0039A0BF19
MKKKFKTGLLSLIALMLVFLSVGPSLSAESMSKNESEEGYWLKADESRSL